MIIMQDPDNAKKIIEYNKSKETIDNISENIFSQDNISEIQETVDKSIQESKK